MSQEYEGDFWKFTEEKLRISHDFSPNLEVGEVIAVPEITITNLDDGTDAADLLMTGSLSFSDYRITYSVEGGVAGVEYKILLKATTSFNIGGANKVLEAKHLMTVYGV